MPDRAWGQEDWARLKEVVKSNMEKLLSNHLEEVWSPKVRSKCNRTLSSWLDKEMKGGLEKEYPPIPRNHEWVVAIDFMSKGLQIHLSHRITEQHIPRA